MSPAAAFHAQLASIMEVLANTAVAEICELVDSGYSVMQLEISRSRKENEVLRRKLRLMELRNARTSALRAAATASGTALLLANGRARAQSSAHHPGNEPRRSGTSGGDNGDMVQSRSNQETVQCGDTDPASDHGQDTSQRAPASGESIKMSPVVIKVEDDDEPWDQSGQNSDPVDDVQIIEDEAPPPSPQTKQEVTEVVSEEVSSTSVSVQNSSQMSEPSYDCLMFEPQLQHMSTHNPLQEDPSCSYSLNTGESVPAGSDSGSSFPFSMGDLGPPVVEQRGLPSGQQRAPQLPVRRDVRLNAYVRRERWNRALNHSADDGTGKTFVCNFCGKTLACLKNLKTHMRVHTGEKPFVCALCGKRFSDSSNLKRHQSVHTGEKRYGCVHCGKRFAQSGSLKVHMSVHTDCKQFKCSHCGKTFISSSHLRRHMTTHAGEKRLMPTFQ